MRFFVWNVRVDFERSWILNGCSGVSGLEKLQWRRVDRLLLSTLMRHQGCFILPVCYYYLPEVCVNLCLRCSYRNEACHDMTHQDGTSKKKKKREPTGLKVL